jgi:uncharacterized membrane protein SpoIIM required for sporulation
MVLERLISLRSGVKQPLWMFFIGGGIALVSLFIAYYIFQTSVGMATSLLITIAMMPFMLNLITYEEEKEEAESEITEMNFLQRHRMILKVYTAFFAGVILSLSLTYMILPQASVDKIFADQVNQINAIRGDILFSDTFSKILMNNVGVLFLSFLFSFLFGAGAVFILAWNASVLATAIGIAAKSYGGIGALPLAILTYFPHGSLEILAYFIGGIAGGLVSTVITRRKGGKFWFIMKDGMQLMIISIIILVIAGFIESLEIVA